MSDYSVWLDQVSKRARTFAVLYLQLGTAHEPARRALLSAEAIILSVAEFMDGEKKPANDSDLIILDDIETLAHAEQSLRIGQLRERVLREVEAGAHFILLSRSPRVAFPASVGSSLLEDASFMHSPAVSGASPEHLPVCAEDGADANDALYLMLKELGAELCASLDRVLFEGLLVGSEAFVALSSRELEALDGSGITSFDGTERLWNLPRHLGPLKNALEKAIAESLEPQRELAEVTSAVWKMERMIRREVRYRALDAWGASWKASLLSETLAKDVLERAAHSAYHGATSVKQLRNPLEWLSLGELLNLKDRREIGDLGISSALWRQFSAQILPIRNSLAHMRSLRPGDSAEALKWLRVLELRLPKHKPVRLGPPEP